jgi:hypothetical protein
VWAIGTELDKTVKSIEQKRIRSGSSAKYST